MLPTPVHLFWLVALTPQLSPQLFGFLNMFLWASNMWFLYKETPFFKGDQLPPQDAGNIGNI